MSSHLDQGHCQTSQVENMAHQHAFILVGEKQLFGVHMTQYHCELHKYQLIVKFNLPQNIYENYLRLHQKNPDDTFILCNAKDKKSATFDEVRSFSVPDIGAGMVTKFTANIFQGMRPLSPEEIESDEHFFPWAKKYAKSALGEFEVCVKRIVTFRPFNHLYTLPRYASYLIFGDSTSGETHMTNLQTAALVTSPFEPPVFGPDYDHVMSLLERPGWLQQDAMLESGVVVTTPIVQLTDSQTGRPTIPGISPFSKGTTVEVLYRGIGPVRSVTAGASYLFSTVVCNSPIFFAQPPAYNSYLNTLPDVPGVFDISQMPKKYWAFAEQSPE
jgi:hypothetical protein